MLSSNGDQEPSNSSGGYSYEDSESMDYTENNAIDLHVAYKEQSHQQAVERSSEGKTASGS